MMKKALMAVALFSALPVLAADYSEKTQYLGVVNGQVVGNSVVKVTRTGGPGAVPDGEQRSAAGDAGHPQCRKSSGIRKHGIYHGETAPGRRPGRTAHAEDHPDGGRAAGGPLGQPAGRGCGYHGAGGNPAGGAEK